jgi:hypothetical protein
MMIEQGRDDSMQETAEAIAHLATAMASDRSTVSTLTTTNAKLANQLEAARALIANSIARLKHSRSSLNLYDKASDRQELQTTTFIAGRTDTKLVNRTPVPHVR